MDAGRWVDVSGSEFPWEQRALDYLKANLPDQEPWRAWGPFTFRAGDLWPEVDCLVVGSRAIFLIEIKSWTGDLTGTDREWSLEGDFGPPRPRVNPMPGANSKARKLKGRLEKTRALSGKRVPWVQPIVFFSDGPFVCRLGEELRPHLAGIDSELAGDVRQGGGLPGVIETLRGWQGGGSINRELSEAVAEAMTELDIRPSERYHSLEHAVMDLENPLEDSADAVAYPATHREHPESPEFRVVFYKPLGGDGEEARAKARRAARREFDLLFPAATHHEGIARAESYDEDHPLGPGILFRVPPDSQRLDTFLNSEEGQELDEIERAELVRKIGEALRYAHSRNMYHRALRPSQVLVYQTLEGALQPVITGWHTGLRAEAAGASLPGVEGTVHVVTGDVDAEAYRSPEALSATQPSPELMDVFGLGALAFLILSAQVPPLLAPGSGVPGTDSLDLAGVDGEIDRDLVELVSDATMADATGRIQSVDEFLELLELALEGVGGYGEYSLRETVSEAAEVTLPVIPISDLGPGDEIERFHVVRRLPRGSSSIALLADREDGRHGVLKIAAGPGDDERIRAEAETIVGFQLPSLVLLLEGPLDLQGRAAIFVSRANRGTLREAIAEEGDLPLERVRRLGADLLEAVRELEERGVFHRDIKPDNIGIWLADDEGEAAAERAMLFDFSLASADAGELLLGTVPYADPFLGIAGRDTFDHAADRYSVAVTLHELLTGTTPQWGDGTASPAHSEVGLVLGEGFFPDEMKEGLTGFFRQALARDASERFASAAQMTDAWEAAVAEPEGEPESGGVEWELPAGAGDLQFPDLVVDRLHDTIRVAFRKRRSRVSDTDLALVAQELRDLPEGSVEFDEDRKRWRIALDGETAGLVSGLAARPEIDLRASAEAELAEFLPSGAEVATQESIVIGPFELRIATPASEPFSAIPPSKFRSEDPVEKRELTGTRSLYEVEGPEDLLLTIGDEEFANGERVIRVVDERESGERFARLERGLRMTVSRHGDYQKVELTQARMKEGDWSNLCRATMEQLNEGFGGDVEGILRQFGAAKIGQRNALINDESRRKYYLCALFPREAYLVPLVAYLVARVAPVQGRYTIDAGEDDRPAVAGK